MINFDLLKRIFLYGMIGSLAVCAIVAITVILTGTFDGTAARIISTLILVIVHSFISLALIWNDSKTEFSKKFTVLLNTLFVLIVLSFVTSVLGVWDIIGSTLGPQLYMTYFLIAIFVFQGTLLAKALGKETYMDVIVYANYVFIMILFFMAEVAIFMGDKVNLLGEMFGRVMASIGIIDVTLSIITVIFYKLYMQKHPELQMPQTTGGRSVFMTILIVIGILVVLYIACLALMAGLGSYFYLTTPAR